jgi:spore germination cell wall hydrolase CwlJ-like protein
MGEIMFIKITLSLIIGICVVLSSIFLSDNIHEMPTKITIGDLSPSVRVEIVCLADNIFFESAYEPTEGKEAVAFVTLNRVNSHRYPNTICGVVKQRTNRTCQFSWYCESTPYELSITKELTHNQKMVYNEIIKLALDVYINYEHKNDPSNGALFYHADYVNPKWRNMIHTATIGRHIFYVREDLI